MAKTYNINELLEKKKAIEKELMEKSRINSEDLIFEKQKIIDHKNEKRTKEYVPREQIGLDVYVTEVSSLSKELAKVKSAIAKHNVQALEGLLQNREALRLQRDFLTTLKDTLKKVKRSRRADVTREVHETGEALETTEITTEPMFAVKEVEKMLSNVAEQERKINTEIQKVNLSAEVEL